MKTIIHKIKNIQDGWHTALYFIDGNEIGPNWSKNVGG